MEALADTRSGDGSAVVRTGWLARFFRSPIPVMLLTATLLAPFLDKAFHIDDTVFVRVAEQILKDPLHPYAFDYNWEGRNETIWKSTQHPPLDSYLIAGVAMVAGFGERPLHIAFAVIAVGCSGIMFLLARRFCKHPTLVVAATVFTPAFLVSSCNVMADVPLLFFWLLAIWLTVVYVETGRVSAIWLAGIAASAAAMTKYFGIALVPLLLVYCLANVRARRWQVIALLLPVAVLTAWGLYAKSEYGMFHPLAAAGYSVKLKDKIGDGSLRPVGCAMSFLGGGMIWPLVLFMLPAVRARNTSTAFLQYGLLAALIGVVTLFEYWSPVSSEEAAPVAQRWVFVAMLVAGGMATFGVLQGWSSRFDQTGLLLAFWFGGTIFFSAFLNWTVNERVILPAIFPAAVLAFRWIESLERPRAWIAFSSLALVPTVIVALLTAASDYEFAAAGRSFAMTTIRKHIQDGRRVHFAGHWGFQYYMEAEGAMAIDFEKSKLQAADLVVYPADPTVDIELPKGWTEIWTVAHTASKDERALFESTYGVDTMNSQSGAGYYSSICGNVPYAPAADGFVGHVVILEYSEPWRWQTDAAN